MSITPARPEPPQPAAAGCLVAPLRALALVVILPLRLAWEAVAFAGRLLGRYVLHPLAVALAWVWTTLIWTPVRAVAVALWCALGWTGRALLALLKLLAIPFVLLGRYVLWPVCRAVGWVLRVLVLVPLAYLFEYVLAPVGRFLAAAWRLAGRVLAWTLAYLIVEPLVHLWRGLVWALRTLVVLPAKLAWRYLLWPACRGAAWLFRTLVVVPLVALYGYVLAPAGRFLAAVWRLAGRVLAWLGRVLVVVPVRWLYVTIVRPAWRGLVVAPWRWTRVNVLSPARQAARATLRGLLG
ncbi:hypothetical protein [Actinomadura parmotrematis]|uniref:Integral membrane protein n=1 Tax=Actinomadura parmotrematis TaxID=2864039 RepID=A0ABS7FNX7_9ACTN|nr:hypothetical protein [Actinomadura parmotrematis]MBW8482099.1 hypothetical protein [Actinomadura parmotrematis]